MIYMIAQNLKELFHFIYLALILLASILYSVYTLSSLN